MSTIGAQYWSSVVGIGATGGAATKQLQQVNCGIGKTATHVQKDGARGTRSRHSGNVVDGPYTVDGPLTVQPSPDELRVLLPYILGGSESGSGTSGSPWSYALAETLPEARIAQDLRKNGTGSDSMCFHWDGCKCASARFSSSAGQQVLTLETNWLGKTQTRNATWPSILSTLTVDKPWIHAHLVLTLGGTAYQVDNHSISIDNVLAGDRMLNSLTRTDIPETDRIITLECDNPFSADDIELYEIAVAGLAGTAVYTNGLSVLTFTFANLKVPAQVLQRAQRGEVMNRLPFTAYETGTPGSTTKELVVSLSTS